MKTLTIIIPSCNMEKYLAKCCESMMVAPELMERLEVLVVNDGSSDGTSEMAHSFERRYPGTFRVIDKENGHYCSCVNRGLAEAAFGVDESIEGRCCSAMCVFRTRMLRDIGYRQTEGILYTDLEWGTFPMLGVRKIKYLPIVVYRYFQGREGQSISAAVAGSRSGDLERVLSRMVDELGGYRGDKGKESFFASRLNSVATNLYHNYLICAPLGEVDAGFARADAIVSRLSGLHASTENVRLSNRLRFHYVAAWRRRRHLPRHVVLLARAYSRLATQIVQWWR